MIKRKKIVIIVDVEEGTEKYIEPSIQEGMEFVENEGIVSIDIQDYAETEYDSTKRYNTACLIMAHMINTEHAQNYATLAKKAYHIAEALLREE